MARKIVFYDGDCGFCNRTVQIILRDERRAELFFSPLQSEFSEAFFPEHGQPAPSLDTFYFFDGQKFYDRSTAALRLIPHLKWYWQPARIVWIIPKKVRDRAYDFIAARRRRLAGSFCVIPDHAQYDRFLHVG